jgi:Uma2 family endonuclease
MQRSFPPGGSWAYTPRVIPSTAFRSDARFTRREFRAWIDHLPRSDCNHYELLRGQIVMSPPAGWTHARIEVRLARLLEEHVAGEGLGLVFGSSLGFDLPSGDTVQPDASFLTTERLRQRPPTHPNQFLRAVPNLVVEVLSPATERHDRTEKKSIYERNEVDEYWIVDPRLRTVTVFCHSADGYGPGRIFRRGIVRSRVLPRLRTRVAALFSS